MIVVPSVDIKNGRCVKLIQGRPGTGLDISGDPVAVAKHWESEGAEMLHLVDLDGAISGSQENRGLVKRLLATAAVPVQVGGGIRTVDDAVSLLSSGAFRVIVGTAALKDPAFVEKLAARVEPRRVLISLDARRGMVLREGWTAETGAPLTRWVSRFEASGVGGFLYTDVSVEGTLKGPGLSAVRKLVSLTRLPIIYAGGISSLDDLVGLSQVGVQAAVVGMALYQGRFSLKEAQEASRRAES
ncbi:MAG: 1-(5-phosphoribosyl)-5-[(5-phosphoribosylamino)methylideneamino]imidazole-4-carboxamide isomerase [Candidatus Bathyarchaeia archaeon]